MGAPFLQRCIEYELFRGKLCLKLSFHRLYDGNGTGFLVVFIVVILVVVDRLRCNCGLRIRAVRIFRRRRNVRAVSRRRAVRGNGLVRFFIAEINDRNAGRDHSGETDQRDKDITFGFEKFENLIFHV